MATTKFKTVEEYIDSHSKEVQKVLHSVQKAIQQAVPEAEEVISYQMPAFKFHGWIFYYSAYANHYSLSCPPPFTVFEKFKNDLASYEVSKSAIKFPFTKPVPIKLIKQMAKFRADQNLLRLKAKGE
ncbi:MAG: DUF1801 domain-containing protein [Chitinophagaceae bacterium]|nr:MAG: DUF1801 domain-containing protein [Chitinophagaceae bacterium]